MSDDTYTLDPAQGTVKSGRFHCTSDGHNKWWRFTYDMMTAELITEWGPLDTTQSQDSRTITTAHAVEVLVNSKLRKGYYPMDDAAPPPGTWAAALDDESEANYEVEDLVDWLSQRTDNFSKSLVDFYDDKGFLTPRQIDTAQGMREQANDPITQPGFYLNPDGDTVRVVRAKAGHFYAVNLDGELIHGGMKGLTGSMLLDRS